MSGNRPSSRGSQGPRRGASRPAGRPAPSRPRSLPDVPAPPHPRLTGRAAILVLVGAVLTVSYASSLRAYLEQRDHLSSLHEQITQSQANIEDLEREQARWDDSAYIRTQARLRFGWVLPGEIGFQVLGADGKPLDHDDSLTDPTTLDRDDEPTWWQAAWESVEVAGNPEEIADNTGPANRIGPPRKSRD